MRSRGFTGLIVLAAVLLFAIPSFSIYYTDWLWFRELGYTGVFFTSLNAQATVLIATFVAAYGFLFANLLIARFSPAEHRLARTVSLVIAGMLAVSSASNWMTWVSFFKAVNFGVTDPLLGRDVAFYVFRLPVFDAVRQQALLLTFVALFGTSFVYLMSGHITVAPKYGIAFWPTLNLPPRARRHLSWLVALFLALMAWGAWLDIPRTMITPGAGEASAVSFGASYTDVHGTIPVLRLQLVILSVGAALAFWNGLAAQRWPLPIALAAYVISVLGGTVYSGFIQQFIVTPNEQQKEQPYIQHNIAATRRAFGLDGVEERELTGDAVLTAKDIANNAETIENVRLWDHQQLLQTFAQIQEIRTYYDFVAVDNDRYRINGKQRQVMLSAREMNTESLPNQSWVNNRLSFTHGYGLTLGPVNQVTTEGLPVLFVQNLPPVSTVDLPVTEPSIYFGEESSNYVLVRTNTPEFHYPYKEDNVTTTYEGSGGVEVGGRLRRLLFAARFGSMEILVSSQLRPDSRIMFHRKITERVNEITPFITFDRDPYLVIDEGRLFWIMDGYTTSGRYPYATGVTRSAESGRINYIRNSVKAVVDAYNGSVSYYMADPTDPIALTIANVFPGLFKQMSEMPAGLREHVRYPEDIFAIQSAVFTTYHMTNPSVFYNKEDQWQVPTVDTADRQAQPIHPYYTVMKLPGEPNAEFIQMLPFTPRLKDNLSAWMVARSDGDHYGKLRVYQFPKQTVIYGPSQIAAKINQDQVISPQITLWSQQGSTVNFGTLLVIPVEESLLYVRPLYLRSSTTRIPELKRVIVAYGNRIVMAETLTRALVQIFGPSIAGALEPDRMQSGATSVVWSSSDMPAVDDVPETPAGVPISGATPAAEPLPEGLTLQQLAEQAATAYDRADAAMKAGDWSRYGAEQKRLRQILERMRAIKR
jgi:uncharacterized membrane protein (UPF0182 family)